MCSSDLDLERITHINADLPQSWKLVANTELPIGGCQLVTDDAEAAPVWLL